MGGSASFPVGQTFIEAHQPRNFKDELDFLERIESKDDWERLAFKAPDRGFAHCEVLKVIMDRQQSKLYYVNSVKWEFHHTFCGKVLKDADSQALSVFNSKMYTNEDRRFFLGTMIYYQDQEQYGLEFAGHDTISSKHIAHFLQCVEKTSPYLGRKPAFKPNSNMHKLLSFDAHQDEFPVRVISNEELFKNTKFQCLTPGVVMGTLKILKNDEAQIMKLNEGDILVCEEIPVDIPPIGGLITGFLQTPLCHVALLCGNRKSPNMALIGATDTLKEYDGKLVSLIVNLREFKIQLAQEKEFEEFMKLKRKKLENLDINSKIVSSNENSHGHYKFTLIDFNTAFLDHDWNKKDVVKFCGSKAAQLYEIHTLMNPKYFNFDNTNIENSFVIPFYYYHQLMELESYKSILSELFPKKKKSPTIELKSGLEELRDKIIHGVPSESQISLVDPLVNEIVAQLSKWKSLRMCSGVIFRSSTNVEDIAEFNGAGLYESLPVEWPQFDANPRDSVRATLLRIWASVWTLRGTEERLLYSIDQMKVKMAILVQPFFSEHVHCNGVALTCHPFRSDYPNSLTVNTQFGNKRVTDGQGSPEQLLLVSQKANIRVEKFSSSSEGDGDVLSGDLIDALVPLLLYMDSTFREPKSDIKCPGVWKYLQKGVVDVEFLVLKADSSATARIVLLQCRPFTKNYHVDGFYANEKGEAVPI